MDIDFAEVRVPFLKRDRPEVHELSGQRWVPVLVDGEQVIADSHRILEYLDHLEGARASAAMGDIPAGAEPA